MPIILTLIGIATAAYFLIQRARNGAEIATELMDVASDVASAARRFGFRRRMNQHPVESIDDPQLAIGAIAQAFLELDDLPTADARAMADVSLRKHLQVDGEAAREISVLGRWLVEQCGGASAAITRVSKKLRALDNGASFSTLMKVLGDVAGATESGSPSVRQAEALQDIAQVFRLK